RPFPKVAVCKTISVCENIIFDAKIGTFFQGSKAFRAEEQVKGKQSRPIHDPGTAFVLKDFC
ncbi:MAG: hypothetical protein AAGH79_19105, partial [Bacteroidota bacterium]